MQLTENEKKIVPSIIDGVRQSAIAAQLGVSQQYISKVNNKDHIREVVERAQRKLIDESLETVIGNQVRKIQLASIILSENIEGEERKDQISTVKDKDLLDLADKAETRIMQSIGMGGAHTQAPVYLNIVNQTNAVLTPEVLQLLSTKQASEADILDIDPEIPQETVIEKP